MSRDYEEAAQASYDEARDVRRAGMKVRDPRQGGEVDRQVDRAQDQAERVAAALAQLAERLRPVLGPERPEPGEVRDSTSPEDWSPLAHRLDSIASALESFDAELRRLTRRIDL